MKKILLLSLISLPMFSMQPNHAKQSQQSNRMLLNTTILAGAGAAAVPTTTLGCLATPIIFTPLGSLLIPMAMVGVQATYRYMTAPAGDNKVNDKIVLDKKTEDKNKNQ